MHDAQGNDVGRGFAESVSYSDTRKTIQQLAGLDDSDEAVKALRPPAPSEAHKIENALYVATHKKELDEIIKASAGLEYMFPVVRGQKPSPRIGYDYYCCRIWSTRAASQRRAGRLDGLLQVAMLLAAGAGIEETLEAVVQMLLESSDHTRASLALWDPESKVLTMAVSLGTAPVPAGTALPYARASSHLQEAIDKGRIIVADYDTDAEPGHLASEFASHLSLIAPIIYDEQILGLLSVDDPGERREFTPEELGFIAGLVAQAAAAIRLATLLDAEREAAKLGAALAEVDALVHSSLDVESITAQALAAGARDRRCCAVIGLDRDGWLTWQSYNFEPSVVGVRLSNEENPHGVAAVTTGTAVAVDDACADPRVNNEFMRGYGLRSVIVAPIFLQGKPVAGLYYNDSSAIHHFTQAEVEFVGNVATSMSVALQNAERFEEERLSLMRAEMVSELLEVAASLSPSEDIGARALEFLTCRADIDAATLWSVDEEGPALRPVASTGLTPAERFLSMFPDGIGIDEPYAVSQAYREQREIAFGTRNAQEIPVALATSTWGSGSTSARSSYCLYKGCRHTSVPSRLLGAKRASSMRAMWRTLGRSRGRLPSAWITRGSLARWRRRGRGWPPSSTPSTTRSWPLTPSGATPSSTARPRRCWGDRRSP